MMWPGITRLFENWRAKILGSTTIAMEIEFTFALTPALSPEERVSLGASLDKFSDLRRRL